MPINRICFPNAPVSGISKADRAQLAVGYPLGATIVTPTTPVQAAFDENYLRRFINDLPKHQKTA